MIKIHNLLTFKILAWIVILNISMTILHYVDNIIFFHEYPEPPWLTAGIVDAFWFLMTPIGLLGLWFARKERKLQIYPGDRTSTSITFQVSVEKSKPINIHRYSH